jgi:hypothetical protein
VTRASFAYESHTSVEWAREKAAQRKYNAIFKASEK